MTVTSGRILSRHLSLALLGVLTLAAAPLVSDAWASDDPLAPAIEKFVAGENAAASKLFEARLRSAPSDARAPFYLGRIAFREGELDDAIDRFREATELAPKTSNYQHWLGQAYLSKMQTVSMFKKMGYAKKARTAWLEAVELDPDNLEARDSLFRYYIEAPGIAGGSESKALEQVEAIKARDPKAGHFTMGSYYMDKEKYDEAEKEYLAVLALDPEDTGALRRIGRVAQEREDWAAAFDAFERALKLDPEDLGALYAIGRTSAISGERADRGIECLEQYLAAEQVNGLPAHTYAHWRMGLIYQTKGDTAKARKAFEAALAIDSGNKEAKKALQGLS